MRILKIGILWLFVVSMVSCVSFTVTSKIYMDVKQNKKEIGRIVFGLFGEIAPKTVENFRHICLRGINGKSYVGSQFHRVVKRFLIQGGDVLKGDGTGSISIFGTYFDDENLKLEHNRQGYLGMANRGPNTNGCQFYVTTVPARWLDGKHTVFGKVLEGMDIVHKVANVKADTEDFPLDPVIISNCGEMPTEPFQYYPDDFNFWGWMKAAGFPVGMSLGVLSIFHYFFRQLNKYC